MSTCSRVARNTQMAKWAPSKLYAKSGNFLWWVNPFQTVTGGPSVSIIMIISIAY